MECIALSREQSASSSSGQRHGTGDEGQCNIAHLQGQRAGLCRLYKLLLLQEACSQVAVQLAKPLSGSQLPLLLDCLCTTKLSAGP